MSPNRQSTQLQRQSMPNPSIKPNPLTNAQGKRCADGERLQRMVLGRSLFLTAFSLVGWLSLTTAALAGMVRIHSIEEGQVKLKREGWSQFHRTFAGAVLYENDFLEVEPGTEVVLICSDGEPSDAVRAGVSGVSSTCPDAPRRVRPSFGVSKTWSASDPSIPYVLTPWSGQVLTAKPDLSWNPVAGAQLYTVALHQKQGRNWSEVWSVRTDQTHLCYPINQPELEFGPQYALRITTGTGTTSSAEWMPPEVFSLMSQGERETAEAAIAAVNMMEVSQAVKTLILVEDVYPNHKLFAKGIEDLQELIVAGTETAQIYRLLGDYFIRSGLETPTETRYLKAVEMAEDAGHLEEQLKAQWGLGTLYNRVGKMDQAREQLTAAQEGAAELGDADLLARIEAELGN